LSWADIAPTRPTTPTDPADPAYRWPADVTAAAAEAPARAIKLSLLVANTPPWANGNRAPIQAPPNPQDYADFLTAAARRYPAVRRWMIWGEPNRDDRFAPNAENDPAGPRAYALLLDAAYAALKAHSPNNKVIGANTWTSGTVKPPDFLRWMRLPSGDPPRLDWFGHNPFPYRSPKLAEAPLPGGFRDISDTNTLSSEVRRTYRRQMPLWLSEYTIQSDHGSIVFATFVSRAVQARYLTAGLRDRRRARPLRCGPGVAGAARRVGRGRQRQLGAAHLRAAAQARLRRDGSRPERAPPAGGPRRPQDVARVAARRRASGQRRAAAQRARHDRVAQGHAAEEPGAAARRRRSGPYHPGTCRGRSWSVHRKSAHIGRPHGTQTGRRSLTRTFTGILERFACRHGKCM